MGERSEPEWGFARGAGAPPDVGRCRARGVGRCRSMSGSGAGGSPAPWRSLVLHAAAVGLGEGRVGGLAGLLLVEAAADVVGALGLGLAAARVVVDGAVV